MVMDIYPHTSLVVKNKFVLKYKMFEFEPIIYKEMLLNEFGPL